MRYPNPAVLLALACCGAFASGGTPSGGDEGPRPAVVRARYALQDSGRGTWCGVNAAQRLALEFSSQGVRLNHPNGSVDFHLTGYGYGRRLRRPEHARLSVNGNRVEYRRADLIEWYVNGSQGLEQGFTLGRRPGPHGGHEPLTIALAVGGGLTPVQGAGEDAVLAGAVLRYAGLRAVDAGGRVLPSRMEARGLEIRLLVDDREAQYPLVVDPTWTQQQELVAPNGAAFDAFGTSVSVDADTVVIGAPAANVYQGAAYVFTRSGGVWSLQQELTASDGMPFDAFGTSVSVSGDTAVVGAIYNGTNGAAYVFVRAGGIWSEQQKLAASDAVAWDQFGASASVSGDTALIGASQKNNSQGAAYVFVRSSGVWTQQQELTAPDGAAKDAFGGSVSVGGNTAVIGAGGQNNFQGAAHVFARSGGVWTRQQELTASDGAAPDQFGYSVTLSGDTMAIGAAGRNNNRGAAYVFDRSGGAWTQRQELAASDGAPFDAFGFSVSLSGDTAVISAIGRAVYVFALAGGVWSQEEEWTDPDNTAGNFGSAVALSGDTTVVGAKFQAVNGDEDRGAAYVFVRPRLGTNNLLVGSAAGSSSVVLSDSGSWTASANDSFLHLSPASASGAGSAVVVFTYDAFSGTGTRQGTLTVAGLPVTVTQVGTNYSGPGPVLPVVTTGLAAYGPKGVAVDGSGNLYIADTNNNAIKEWSAATQQVTTLGPSGLKTPYGVAVDASGNVYIADTGNGAIRQWSPSTQQLSTLVSSGLYLPGGVAVDASGNVYIGDTNNNALKQWNAAAQRVTTLVSTGLSTPMGVAVDRAGTVYLADDSTTLSDDVIKQWSAATHQLTTLVPSGLEYPTGVAVDGSGNVYIADRYHHAIKQWSASTQQVSTLVSSGLGYPWGVAVDGSGNLFIADNGNSAIYELPYAFAGPAALTEPAAAGYDSLLQTLPATAPLTGIFAPASDQGWLTIGTVANGIVNFSFTANPSGARVAHITVLGQQLTVTQSGAVAQPQTIAFAPLANRMYGAQPFTLTATASSGLPVGFDSQTTFVCAVYGTTVTLLSTGTCTIHAAQPGDAAWAAAASVSRSFQVTPYTCAVTGDATASIADVQLVINQVLGLAPPGNDMNHDGALSVTDAQKVVNAALGMGCPY